MALTSITFVCHNVPLFLSIVI